MAEGIIRSTRWGSPYEEGGRYDWHAIAKALSDVAEPDHLISELEALAERLLGLRDRLAARGVPPGLLDKPALGMQTLDGTLKRWRLA